MRKAILFTSILVIEGLVCGPAPARSEESDAKPGPVRSSSPIAASSPAAAATRVHPLVTTLFSHRERTGETLPFFRRHRAFEQSGLLPLVVRFRTAPVSAKIEALATRGVTFARGGRPLLSGAYLVHATREGAHHLEADDEVTRVSPDLPSLTSMPGADDGGLEVGAVGARRALLTKDGTVLDGSGTLIADIDSPIYVQHPSFFRADGGTYPWVDVDKSGELTVGVDGVDLDQNGSIEPGEVFRLMLAKAVTPTGLELEGHTSFAADRDYLFLDTNGNGKRDVGASEGFDEKTPAHGEPIFVFDDADHDGVLTTRERVVRLGTSKVRKIRSANKVFERGGAGATALIRYDAKSNPVRTDTEHATAVAGILLGGHPGVSRWMGIAPGAELVSDDGTSDNGRAASVQWAIDQKANVILTEWASYSTTSLDGSNEEDLLLDAANDTGIQTVSPAGNLAISKKHRTVRLKSGATKLTMVGDAILARASGVAISIHYRGAARGLTTSLKLPDGGVLVIPESAPAGVSLSGKTVYAQSQTTPRGTRERFIQIVEQGTQVAQGTYELTLGLDDGPELDVDLFAGDNAVAWAGGFTFDQGTTSRTLCSPATSDKTIAVGAYVLNSGIAFSSPGQHGDLSVYSSRGPRLLDGKPGILLVAPDNPVTTAPPKAGAPVAAGSTNVVGFTSFGGTSGAGPHVAGAIALMRQAFPKAGGDEARQRLLNSAKSQGATDEALQSYGRGKLDVEAAVGGAVSSGPAPALRLTVEQSARVGGDAKVHLDADDDEPQSALFARWDVDYDGDFDTAWIPLGTQPIPAGATKEGDRIGVKVEVRDGQGNLSATTIELPVAAADAPSSTTASAPGDDAGGAGGCQMTAASTTSTSVAGGGALAVLAMLLLTARRRSSCARPVRVGR